nr:MAG TPA: hypothetical protein [Caudoviricetes sp.]DAH76182.1 MAG TPA: hypothetical protein [Caudoviricetes sp.]
MQTALYNQMFKFKKTLKLNRKDTLNQILV